VDWLWAKWLWVGLAALGLWWFFTGETPVSLARAFVGRGHKLTVSTDTDGDGLNEQSLDDLCAQIRDIVGRDVDPGAVIMARVAASENGKGTAREKTAIMLILANDAATHFGGNVFACATNGHKWQLGAQKGPGFVARYSTIGGGLGGYREIHEEELALAEDVRAGRIGDFTGGAEKFIHYTGYRRLADFLVTHPKVQGWIDSGLEPVSLGGVGVLVVFTRTPGAANVG
jgi:hypothetical protein